MIESLRRWGGQFANAPVFAVTPRLGPPLANKTRQAFEKLHVEYLRLHENSRYSWNKFLNKPYALVAVDKHTTSECIAWLDSDLLILGAPDQLILNEAEDFLACAPDKNIGTTGQKDRFEPYWQEVCNYVGIDIEDLPWIRTEQEGARIRLYWNSGVFAYRRSTGFSDHYLQTCIQLFGSRIASLESSIFFNDQIALGLTMVKMGISWRALPYSHNYTMGSKTHKDWYSEDQLKAARIVHYHDAMWPHFWSEFINCLRVTHPQVADWLSSIGPMKNEAPFYCRSMSKILQYSRAKQESAYTKLCKVL
jgi:lipopolysaccharide biosynthesis glycosyltransferase